ncbi:MULTISPECIES: cell division protein ZapC [Vibrio]|uniref:cell division protein ZapC n=1 Tax=Vibrio TaxID=662 RepID=UPI001B147A55|nr:MULTISPECIES: cell division protein ZapC [Vibrio]BBM64636.1 cell division protein ZapC [Vibrio alfacsensis]BCN24202.1 cell division protein ZapC [Vibrio alfacsensis]CAE6961920.1 Contributes to the efficiency of the cell division process by stabilizing the polymeric form of the cell division protein FtsZ. Acts by promoting interactions between FtsZ protofilaments and suppressing the GTPase activity of FtsZ [Vibrio sp. B1REV9]
MLKPSDKWNWYFDEQSTYLMLDLGEDMLFQTNLSRKLLVNCAFSHNEFTVDDASAFQTYSERIRCLDINEYRQAELTLYCVAAKRFHKPVQPKSWFFDAQSCGHEPEEGDMVFLNNQYSDGVFIVLEAGDSSSLCAYVGQDEFLLDGNKCLQFGQPIKVMHDRMSCANHLFILTPMAMVG